MPYYVPFICYCSTSLRQTKSVDENYQENHCSVGYLLTSALKLTADRYMFGVLGLDIIHLLLLHTDLLYEWFLCWVHLCMVCIFVTSGVSSFVTLMRSRAPKRQLLLLVALSTNMSTTVAWLSDRETFSNCATKVSLHRS